MDVGRCESCGREGERELRPVRRVYVTPAAWDQEGSAQICDEIEQWCLVCLEHYPHQPVE